MLIAVDDWVWNAKRTLELSAPYPGDAAVEGQLFHSGQFFVKLINDGAAMYVIEDTHLDYVLAIDSRSMGDFMSTTLVQQLKLKKTELATPLPLQMACQGSHSRINHSVTIKFEYQKISGN